MSYFTNRLSVLKFLFFSLTESPWFIVSQPLSLCSSLIPPPYLSLFSCFVVCPQVEYNSYLPRGVMNGRPLLKCLSITFECSFSLTSEQHIHWPCTHKQGRHMTGGSSLWRCFASVQSCSVFFVVLFFSLLYLDLFNILAIHPAQLWEERPSRGCFTGNLAPPNSFLSRIIAFVL